MHQATWVHRHLQACNFVFDPGWRRLHRQWCIYQLFAGRFQDDEAYHKWRVHLWRRRAVRVRRRRRRGYGDVVAPDARPLQSRPAKRYASAAVSVVSRSLPNPRRRLNAEHGFCRARQRDGFSMVSARRDEACGASRRGYISAAQARAGRCRPFRSAAQR